MMEVLAVLGFISVIGYGVPFIAFFMLGYDSMDYHNKYKYQVKHIIFFSYFLGQLTYRVLNFKLN